ncbi:hypothetical protein [Roseofilum casamattae]|uniref:Uncharacterized protein n=1 Tax=Roseofilum casamattae BLCC-M143 TaxID=3022442 RepID=A0ABT7BTV0_9CYAN|nr:hypothetical protein [Roseofilum casamattae]MDJ1182611.1 hypothetical protein [Roseofilum casamattae BLCC-M143]
MSDTPPPKQGFAQWVSYAAGRFGFAGVGYILGAVLVLVIGWFVRASQQTPESPSPESPPSLEQQ